MLAENTVPEAVPAAVATAGVPMTHKEVLAALAGVLSAFFTAMLSSTIVINALPTIMVDLHGSQTDFAWVITAALLANAATTPIWGKLADLFDKKKLIQLSIIVFVAGSVLAGFAHTMPLLLAARVIQGIAMGGLGAMSMAILGTIIAPRERGRYSGYMGATMAVSTAGGPLLGGLIVDSPLGWRWTFFLCVPLAVASLVIIQKTLQLPHFRRPVYIDWAGSALLTAAVCSLLIWVSFAGKAGYFGWVSWQSAVLVGAGVLLAALLVMVETRVPQPIIPLKIIAERTTALSILASIAVGVAMFGAGAYLGQYFQLSRGASPTEAGLLTLPLIAGNFCGSTLAGTLISRFGRWKRFLVIGALLNLGGMAALAFLTHETPLWQIGVAIAAQGLGLGMLMQNLVLAVQNTVRVTDIGTASSSVAFFRTFGGAVGTAVLGSVMAGQLAHLGAAPSRSSVEVAYADGTATVFLLSAAVAVVTLVAVLFIKEVPLRRTIG